MNEVACKAQLAFLNIILNILDMALAGYIYHMVAFLNA